MYPPPIFIITDNNPLYGQIISYASVTHFSYSSIPGHPVWHHSYRFVDNAAVNTGMHVSLCYTNIITFGKVLRREI